MALKKTNEPYTPKGIIEIDREWWDSDEKKLCGDMQWSFEEMPETKTLDLDYARKWAINMVVSDREEFECNDTGSVYFISDEEQVVEIVSGMSVKNKDFAKELEECYSGVKFYHVPAGQKYIDLPEDVSMSEYNGYCETIEEGLDTIISQVKDYSQNEVMSILPVEVHDHIVTGISWHVGMDHDIYYQLNGPDLNYPGMNYDRLCRFFTNNDLTKLASIAEMMEKNDKRVSIYDIARDLAIEITVGGDRFDREDIFSVILGSGNNETCFDRIRQLTLEKAMDMQPDGHSKESVKFFNEQLDYWLNNDSFKEYKYNILGLKPLSKDEMAEIRGGVLLDKPVEKKINQHKR